MVYAAEAIDAETMRRIAQTAGEAVRIVPFIQLQQHPLKQLPLPPTRGDVQLVTAKNRSGMQMHALGRFSLHYDASLACIYVQDTQGQRLLPVFPFGYWATSDPLRVFDYDGNLAAQPGGLVEFGGGNVDVEHIRATNTCGATSAFIGQPSTTQR